MYFFHIFSSIDDIGILILIFRAGSATEEALIRGKITQTVEAIENAVGLKSAAHFMTMPAVLNK